MTMENLFAMMSDAGYTPSSLSWEDEFQIQVWSQESCDTGGTGDSPMVQIVYHKFTENVHWIGPTF